MRFTVISGIMGIAAIMAVFTATVACATPRPTLLQTGKGTYVVQGSGLDKVAGMDFVINYDATTMANPRVTQGSLNPGMLMVTNTSQPGTMRIAFVDSYPNGKSGSGTIAEITFDTLNNSPGKVNNFNPILFDVNGTQVILGDGGQTSNTTQATDTNTDYRRADYRRTDYRKRTELHGGQTMVSGLANVIGGTSVTPSSPVQDMEKPKGDSPASPPAENPKQPTNPDAVKEPGESQPTLVASLPPSGKKVTIQKSVLERFREFQGEKTPRSLMALFTAEALPGIRQVPAVALSDGTTIVKVSINLPIAGNVTPNFALNGAKMTSLKIEGKDWVLSALPDKGVYEASVTVMYGDSLMEIPLTVAPRVTIDSGRNGAADEALFVRFLAERSRGKAPLFDLNGDGVRNYIDDYIFTANYLTMPVSKGPGNAAGEKTP